jgi:hypothetical protein
MYSISPGTYLANMSKIAKFPLKSQLFAKTEQTPIEPQPRPPPFTTLYIISDYIF